MVFKICHGFVFISHDNQFEGKLVADSDSGHFFKWSGIPSTTMNERMPSEEAKDITLSTCNSPICHPSQNQIGGKVANNYWLSIEPMSRDFWMLLLAALQLNILKRAKNHYFSNTEINNREGDGMGYTIYIICISSYERHMEISVGRNNL